MIKKLLFLFVSLLMTAGSQAQWVNYNVLNTRGVYEGCVFRIAETSDGLVWFALNNKLWSFDRSTVNWKQHTLPAPMASAAVYTLHVDASGRLWAGTELGAACRQPDHTWQAYDTDDGLAGNVVRAMCNDNYGKLWFATYDGGICRLSNSQWTYYGSAEGVPTYGFLSAFCDSQGRLWFGTASQGVALKNFAGWHHYTSSDGLAGNTIYDITEDANHKVFMTGEHGMTTYFNGYWETITMVQGMPADFAYGISAINDSTLWIATDSGIAVYQYPAISLITQSEGLKEDAVMSLCKDSHGRIWAGHKNSGVSWKEGLLWDYFADSEGLKSNTVNDAAEGSNDTLWFATQIGLTFFKDGSWRTLKTEDGLPYNSVREMETQADGSVWCVFSDFRVGRRNGNTWQVWNESNGLKGMAYCMYRDTLDRIWVGYYYGNYISHYDGSVWVHDSVSHTKLYIYDILVIPGGDTWLACNDGIHRKHNGLWSKVTDPAVPEVLSTSVSRDQQGRIWFSFYNYYDGGLCYYENETWHTPDIDYLSHYINEVFFDSDQRMWLASNINYFPYNAVMSCMQDNAWIYYSNNDGIGGRNFTAFMEDSGHRLWALSGDQGVSMLPLVAVGLHENENAGQNLKLFPNPAHESFRAGFTAETSGKIRFMLYNMQGQCCFVSTMDTDAGKYYETLIPSADLPCGLYLFIIENNVQRMQQKLLIHHP